MPERIEKPIKAWVTEYVLTNDILEITGTHLTTLFACWNIDDFATEREAIDRANKMRLRKIESLKKRIRKLEAMEFRTKGETKDE